MSDTAKPKRIRVSLTCEERLLLASLLTGARSRDAETIRLRQRIIKTLEILAPDPRKQIKTFMPADTFERARLEFEVLEIKNKDGNVISHAPKIQTSLDKPREFRFLPIDHAHIVQFLDPLPEGLDQPSSYQWLGLLDAFALGEAPNQEVDEEASSE